MGKVELRHRSFVRQLISAAQDCRTGRGEKYFMEKVGGVWYAVGMSPTLPSSKERNEHCYKYKIIIGYEADYNGPFRPSGSDLDKLGEMLEILTTLKHDYHLSVSSKTAPFEWMKVVKSERGLFRDNGYMCKEWFIR